jgi:hypothetical protein
MAASSAATEAVADHEKADGHRREYDDEQDAQEFHGSIPSLGDGAYFSPSWIFTV